MQSNRTSKRFWIFGLLAATAALPALAQPVFSGNELRLSGPEHARLLTPTVGFFEDEGFVAVWEDRGDGLVVRAFGADAEALGVERVLVAHDPIGELPFHGLLASRHQPELLSTGGESFLLFWTEEREQAWRHQRPRDALWLAAPHEIRRCARERRQLHRARRRDQVRSGGTLQHRQLELHEQRRQRRVVHDRHRELHARVERRSDAREDLDRRGRRRLRFN